MVRMVEGDLFDPSWGFDAIGHGVNCKGVMGAGIAKVFKQKYALMYDRYATLCDQAFLLPGQVYPYRARPTRSGSLRWIYNIASQYKPGADADYRYLRMGLEYVRFHMDYKGLTTLGLPWIGAGIGGLDKEGVLTVVSDVFQHSGVDLTIVSLPE